jgi:hypothetical protein
MFRQSCHGALSFFSPTRNERTRPATATMVTPGHKKMVSINPNGLPAFVPTDLLGPARAYHHRVPGGYSPPRGRIHLRGLSSPTSNLLQSGGGPYIPTVIANLERLRSEPWLERPFFRESEMALCPERSLECRSETLDTADIGRRDFSTACPTLLSALGHVVTADCD